MLAILLMPSCTVEKRYHSLGCHINWKPTQPSAQLERVKTTKVSKELHTWCNTEQNMNTETNLVEEKMNELIPCIA